MTGAQEIEQAATVPSIARIKEAVATYYNLSPLVMSSARRARNLARPRMVAMFLAKELTVRSLPEIGRAFGNRDHTTVMHACRVIGELVERDQRIAYDVRHLRAVLSQGAPFAVIDGVDSVIRSAMNALTDRLLTQARRDPLRLLQKLAAIVKVAQGENP